MSANSSQLRFPQPHPCDFKLDFQYRSPPGGFRASECNGVTIDVFVDPSNCQILQRRFYGARPREGHALYRTRKSKSSFRWASYAKIFRNYWAWGLAAVIGGMAASTLAYLLLPVHHWGVWLAIGIFVSASILLINPRWIYKRLLIMLISAGLIGNVLDGTLSINLGGTNLYWQGSVNLGFLMAWVLVIGVVVWADYRQNGCNCARQK